MEKLNGCSISCWKSPGLLVGFVIFFGPSAKVVIFSWVLVGLVYWGSNDGDFNSLFI